MDDNVQQSTYNFEDAFGGAPDDENSLLGITFSQHPLVLPSSLSHQTPFFPASSVPPSAPSSGLSLAEPLPTVQPQALHNFGGGGYSTSGENVLPAISPPSVPLPMHLGDAREKHGQYTPDSDNTPKRDVDPRVQGYASKGQSNAPDQADHVKDKRQKRAPSAAKSKASSPKRQPRKASVDESDPEEAQKRQSFLERNRKAAYKCREKKKEWVTNLEEQCRDLEATNRMYQVELGFLRSEAFDLKNKVFQHSNCQFGPIDAFIDAQAQKVCNSANVRTASQPRPPSNTGHSANPAIRSAEFPGLISNARFDQAGSDTCVRSAGSRSPRRSMTVEADSLHQEEWA